jgi:hypothetical protein
MNMRKSHNLEAVRQFRFYLSAMPTLPSCPEPAEPADAVISRTRRWLETAVIGLNLCPFAKAVHVREQIAWRVSTATSQAELAEDLRAALRELAAADAERLDTLLLIHPGVLADFDDYNAFLAQADRIVRKLRLEGELQVASFHPDYQFADSAPDQVDNATNRSPYPMLHLLRESSIERAVASYPDPERIYARNIASLRKLGWTGWQDLARAWQAHSPAQNHPQNGDNLSPAAVDKLGDTPGTIEKMPYGANT